MSLDVSTHPFYELGAVLGTGGSSKVYRARHRDTGHEVAFKQWNPPPTHSVRPFPRWDHANLAKYLEGGSNLKGDFVVMELVEGKPVSKLTKERQLTPEELTALFRQALDGLAAAHKLRVLHGDIHAGNILVSGEGAALKATLIDFTLRELAPEAKPMFGNIYTMAPEKFENQPCDERSDLYSLGCTFFYAAYGKYPFEGSDSVQIAQAHVSEERPDIRNKRAELPEHLGKLILSLIARHREKRPASAAQALALISGR